jgi:hypothetical protein
MIGAATVPKNSPYLYTLLGVGGLVALCGLILFIWLWRGRQGRVPEDTASPKPAAVQVGKAGFVRLEGNEAASDSLYAGDEATMLIAKDNKIGVRGSQDV